MRGISGLLTLRFPSGNELLVCSVLSGKMSAFLDLSAAETCWKRWTTSEIPWYSQIRRSCSLIVCNLLGPTSYWFPINKALHKHLAFVCVLIKAHLLHNAWTDKERYIRKTTNNSFLVVKISRVQLKLWMTKNLLLNSMKIS